MRASVVARAAWCRPVPASRMPVTTLTRPRSLIQATLGLAVLAAAAFGVPARAAYSDVYVFGDSLSDMGRVYALTGGTFPAPPLYAAGRFSNGPVAVETMTLALTGSPLLATHNFAVGGARTGVSPFPNTSPGPSNPTPPTSDNNNDFLTGTGLQRQAAQFQAGLAGSRADPNALYVVWAGSNDMSQAQVLGNVDGAQWSRVIGNIETAIDSLAAAGATHFFVPNIPNLGLTPRAAAGGPAEAAAASFLSGQFDAQLATRLAGFDAARPAIDLKLFDVYSLITTVVASVRTNGSYLGLTDVTTQCQSGCADPAASLFWDDLHPTAVGHALLGNAFAVALVPEPETYALMLGGLGIVAWEARRRAARRAC